MASDQTRVKNVPQSITRENAIMHLQERKSPAAPVAGRVYDYAVARQLDARFLLGVFEVESQSGTDPNAIALTVPTHSWGNTTNPSFGDPGLGPPYARGRFTRYADWYAGGISTVARFFDHAPYAGKDTVRAIIETWAPPEENDTERYIARVVEIMNALGGDMTATPIIAISAGHHNKQGGDRKEIEQTGELANALGIACRALGMTVVHLTPDEGRGFSPLSLDTLAAKINVMNPLPAIYIECHTEGGGGSGVFTIYPDWDDDVDTDVRDTLGPGVSRAVAAATGLKLGAGGDGVMSEKQTGVGSTGSRLGIFRATAPVRREVTRCIVEFGAHDRQPDLGIADTPGFALKCANATALAFAKFLGWQVPIPAPTADPITQDLIAWYMAAATAQLQGDLGNATFHEINIDWKLLPQYVALPADARGIRGEYYAGWWNPAKRAVDPIHLDNWLDLQEVGAITPRI